ncbi:hypothetical protein B0H19DRAFT_1124765 [Mycena capillaripes]|nr:hypothetical protein B0H19DRAFT_1124765 [Mycena capillaripes]
MIADPHRSPSPTTPNHDTLKQPPRSPSPAAVPARGLRVIVRFDLNATHQPVQRDPEDLYLAIEEALQVKDRPLHPYLGGVRWTQRGNLVLHPSTMCTASYLQQRKADIWGAICPLLDLPKPYKVPPFEQDAAWHSVVIHGVPKSPDGKLDSYTLDGMNAWLNIAGAFVGGVTAYSILCCPENLEKRCSLAIRVTLSAETDAQWLIKNGACFYGTKCRVTQYLGKLRAVTPSPEK